MRIGGRPGSGDPPEAYGSLRPTTPWWLWALAIFLTAGVVFALLDALNTPEPGSVVLPYVLK